MVETPLPWGMVSETSWERPFARNDVESNPTRSLAICHDASITHLALDPYRVAASDTGPDALSINTIPGVEATTGPLGQSVATSVGMTMAGRWLGARFNREGHTLFDHQSPVYQESVPPTDVIAAVAVERATAFDWRPSVGDRGAIVGMHTLGASAPLRELQTKFVFTADSVYRVARETLEARRGQQ